MEIFYGITATLLLFLGGAFNIVTIFSLAIVASFGYSDAEKPKWLFIAFLVSIILSALCYWGSFSMFKTF